jgi:putative cell wall-binding protein
MVGAGGNVYRWGGASRDETSAMIAQAFFPAGSANTMFLATGQNFPDALAGGALAGYVRAPILLTRPTCTPAVVHDTITELANPKTVVLGGTDVVSDAAAKNTACP